jgi:antitoxin MazE
MRARVEKWGNSLALRIPEPLVAELGLTPGALVEISIACGRLVVSVTEQPNVTLEALLAGVTADNAHVEIDTGPSIGSEA